MKRVVSLLKKKGPSKSCAANLQPATQRPSEAHVVPSVPDHQSVTTAMVAAPTGRPARRIDVFVDDGPIDDDDSQPAGGGSGPPMLASVMIDNTEDTSVPRPVDATAARHRGNSDESAASVHMPIGALQLEPYYHGLLPRDDAIPLLCKDGDFLVRRTEVEDLPKVGDKRESLVITMMWKRPQHLIVHNTPNYSLWYIWNKHALESPTDLIKYHLRTGTTVTSDGGKLVHAVSRQAWQLSHEQIELGRLLGSGTYGDVFEARLRLYGQQRPVKVAVKRLKAAQPSKADREEFIKEARLIRKYKHRHIVRLVGVACQQQPIMLVLELAAKGSLLAHLRKRGAQLPAVQRVVFARQAACGLRYLERNQLIHRDVAARNCLLGDELEVKITDFGLALQQHFYKETTMKPVPIKWLAPETMLRSEYSIKSDVWAYGVLMWEIFSNGAEPYANMSNAVVIRRVVLEDYRMEQPAHTPDFASDVMKQCWARKPDDRPAFATIVTMLSGHRDDEEGTRTRTGTAPTGKAQRKSKERRSRSKSAEVKKKKKKDKDNK